MGKIIADVKKLIGTKVTPRHNKEMRIEILDAERDFEGKIRVVVACSYCGKNVDRNLNAIQARRPICPECIKINMIPAIEMSVRVRKERDASNADLMIGETIYPKGGGKPSKLLAWEMVPTGNSRNNHRHFTVACTRCGTLTKKTLSAIRKRETRCTDCAHAEIGELRKGSIKINTRIMAINTATMDALIGTTIMPEKGIDRKPTKVIGWRVVDGKTVFNVTCAECGEHIERQIREVSKRTVLCPSCTRARDKKIKDIRAGTAKKFDIDDNNIPVRRQQSNTIPFMPCDRPITTAVKWKSYEDEEYQKKLNEIKSKYGG